MVAPARFKYDYVLRLLIAGNVPPDEARRIAAEFPL